MAVNVSVVLHPNDPFHTTAGWTYAISPVYTGFEIEKVNLTYWTEQIAQTRNYAYYAGAIYMVGIFGLQRFMRDREALDLRAPLIIWNLILGLGSMAGFIRSAPGLFAAVIQPNGLYKSMCFREEMDMPTMFWGLLFALSKYVELGDTVFTLLRKRPLLFIHWYHHLVTLWVVWITAPLAEPFIRWGGVINTGVHAIMYPCLAYRATGRKLPAHVVYLVAILEMGQMVVGICLNFATWYLQSAGHQCVRDPLSIKVYGLAYGSFFIFFGAMFFNNFILKKRKDGKKND